MSNESVQLHLAKDAAQLIANGLPTFDKPDNAVNPPRLRTVLAFDMSKPGAWRERRDLYRALCHTPTGKTSFEAADLYEDILDLWQQADRVQNFSKRHNCFYWGRPIAKWAKKYKCTERQFDYWLKVLRDCKLIATCMMKTKTNMLQIRPLVAEGSACLSGWPDSQNFKHLVKAETQVQQGQAGGFCPAALEQNLSQCISTNFVPPKDLGLAVSFGMYESLDSVAASPATKAITANSSMPTGKTSQKPNQPPDAVVVPKVDKTPLKNGKRPLTIARVWEGAQREFHPGYAVSLTRDDCKVLRDVRNKLHEAGVSPDVVVRFAVEHWFSALFGINGGSGLKFTPKTFSSYLGNFLAHFKTNYVSPEQAAEEKAKHDAYVAKWDAEIAAEKAAKALAAASAPKLSKWLQPKADEANKQATTKSANPPAVPYPCADAPEASKPATEAVSAPACPANALADPVTPVLELPDLEEGWPEPTFEACRAWSEQAMAGKRARDEAARIKSKIKLTASASYHYKPHATA